jgi:hypothetical protein
MADAIGTPDVTDVEGTPIAAAPKRAAAPARARKIVLKFIKPCPAARMNRWHAALDAAVAGRDSLRRCA